MRTISEPVKVTIPAAYLEDVRTAIFALIKDDDYGDNLVEDNDILAHLLDATADTTLSGNFGAVYYMLQNMLAALVEQVEHLAQTWGTDADAIPELRDRVGWASRESLRINPLGR
jgi:hypothetical protein